MTEVAKVTYPKAQFDPKNPHVRDPRSGRVVRENLHRFFVEKDGDGTRSYYEYPRGSGMFYHPNMELDHVRSGEGLRLLAGRLEKERLAAIEAAKTPEEKKADALKAAVALVKDSGALDEVLKKAVDEAVSKARAELRKELKAESKDPIPPVQPKPGA